MGTRVRIATVCQGGQFKPSVQQNRDYMLGLLEVALQQRPDLVCLPEAFHNVGVSQPPHQTAHHGFNTEHVQERIVELALAHPTRGCNYLAAHLAQQGVAVSFVTVQNVLNRRGLGSRYERLLALENKALEHQIELTPEQVLRLVCLRGPGHLQTAGVGGVGALQ
jgi:hypothetical protein